ncbi:MAG: hypothetical protein H6510_08465 [Acidobacteria bacterium]|nr:hypothetical protein [Acidobacteriota bacterium]MCB9397834.1 hypothetical protein [Acidobacteriota bacterium]
MLLMLYFINLSNWFLLVDPSFELNRQLLLEQFHYGYDPNDVLPTECTQGGWGCQDNKSKDIKNAIPEG